MQAPVDAQQAPVGCEQGLGEQTVSAPNQELSVAQVACLVIEQTPPEVQHAPFGFGHLDGEHWVPAPCHAFGATQSATTEIAQFPAGSQQAPAGCGQGFGVQVSDADHAAAQWVSSVTVQEPSAKQQDPVGISTPIPTQSTVADGPVPVVMVQVLVPVESGRKSTVASLACPAEREYSPPPARIENSTQEAAILPVSVPAPMLLRVKERSAVAPSTTWPKIRLSGTTCPTGSGPEARSESHPARIEAARSMIGSQHTRPRMPPTTSFMVHPRVRNSLASRQQCRRNVTSTSNGYPIS